MCYVYVDISNDGLDFSHELTENLFNVGMLRTQMFIYIHTSTSSEKQFKIWFQTKSKFYPRLDRRH